MSLDKLQNSVKLILPESPESDLQTLLDADAGLDTTIAMPPLPESFSIKLEMTPVKDQGSLGSCTSFCVAACLEHIHRRALSEGHMQHTAEKTHGDCIEGLAMVHSFAICQTQGAVDESVWGYDEGEVCLANPPDTTGAAHYRFNDHGVVYQRRRAAITTQYSVFASETNSAGLPLTLAIQRQLFGRRRPVACSVPVYREAWPWSGEIVMPSVGMVDEYLTTYSSNKEAGWHAIPICGWDNSTGRFIFKNSWGTFWGDKGYGSIPYQYIDKYSDLALVAW